MPTPAPPTRYQECEHDNFHVTSQTPTPSWISQLATHSCTPTSSTVRGTDVFCASHSICATTLISPPLQHPSLVRTALAEPAGGHPCGERVEIPPSLSACDEVANLTKIIETIGPHPIAHGGFSDIYLGELAEPDGTGTGMKHVVGSVGLSPRTSINDLIQTTGCDQIATCLDWGPL
jgi:hypothetical protein